MEYSNAIVKKESVEFSKSGNPMLSSSNSIVSSASLKYLCQKASYTQTFSKTTNKSLSCIPSIESTKTALTDSLIMSNTETRLTEQKLIQKCDSSPKELVLQPKIEQLLYPKGLPMDFRQPSDISSVSLTEKSSSTPDACEAFILSFKNPSLKVQSETQSVKPVLIKTKQPNDSATQKGSSKLLNLKDLVPNCFTKAMVPKCFNKTANVIHLSEKSSSLPLNKTFLPSYVKIVKPPSLSIVYVKKAPLTKPNTDNFVAKKKSVNILNMKESTKRKLEDLQVENTVPTGYSTDSGVISTNGRQLDSNAMNCDESFRIPCAPINNKKSSPDIIKLSSKTSLQKDPSTIISRDDAQIRKLNLPKIQSTNGTVMQAKPLGKTLGCTTVNSPAVSLNTKFPIMKRMPCVKNSTIPLARLGALYESKHVQHHDYSVLQSQYKNDSHLPAPSSNLLPSSEKKGRMQTLVKSTSILMCDDIPKICDDLEKKKMEAMHGRRIVYVGNLPCDYTETQLKSRFKVFGEIENIEIKSKDCDSSDVSDLKSDGYFGNAQPRKTNGFDAWRLLRERKKKFFGFITFKTQADATKAIEGGNNCEGPVLHLNYGGRRHFVKEDYTDLDGDAAQYEEKRYSSRTQYDNSQEKDDYSLLLKQEQQKRGLVSDSIHSCHEKELNKSGSQH